MVSRSAVRSEERTDEYENTQSEEKPGRPGREFSAFRIHISDAYRIVTALRTQLRVFHLLPPQALKILGVQSSYRFLYLKESTQ
jgi:hypothetical protein